MRTYKLINKVPVLFDDFTDKDVWKIENRRVAETKLTKDIWVSTVFLVLDHSFNPNGPVLLFESMIFGGKKDGYQARYSTWEEAEVGHKKAVDLAFKSLDKRTRCRIKRIEKQNNKT